jgi:hypothetical protein
METCCWLAALARAVGLDVFADYWLTRAAEAWWPGVGPDA